MGLVVFENWPGGGLVCGNFGTVKEGLGEIGGFGARMLGGLGMEGHLMVVWAWGKCWVW